MRRTVEGLESRLLLAGEPWGAFPALVEQAAAISAFGSITGAGQTIAILDSGINWADPILGGGFGAGHKVIAGYDFVDNDADPMDPNGHGTAAGSLAAGERFVYRGTAYQGVAPDANLVALRVDNGGAIDDVAMEKGLRWVLDHRVQYNIVAINISNGGWEVYSEKTTNGSRYADELAALKAAGVFIAVCSGNDGVTDPLGVEYPAADPSVFSVGGINDRDQIWSGSTRGAILDLVAPAENVPLTFSRNGGGSWIMAGSGTSYSSPYVAGTAALLKQVDPTLTPDQIGSILSKSSHPVFDGATGLTFDRLDVYDAIALAVARRDGVVASPFSGRPVALPATIEAENFDLGGEGIAYHDRSAANQGGAYRGDGPDVEATADGSGAYDVGWTRAGEWLRYGVTVPADGYYTLSFRVAAGSAGGTFHVEAKGRDVTGPISIPNTGGWQNWQTIVRPFVVLKASTKSIRVLFDRDGSSGFVGNLNWIRIEPTPTTTPYGGVAAGVPGVIQAENFDKGAHGAAYYDLTTANEGGMYRKAGVDLEVCSDVGGGYSVGWTAAGEWLAYTINVAGAGTYTLDARVASLGTGGTFHVEIDGIDRTGPMVVPNTGGWQTWQTISRAGIDLTAGMHVVRLVMDSNGSGGTVGNFNWLKLS
jgi:hypothetical protein